MKFLENLRLLQVSMNDQHTQENLSWDQFFLSFSRSTVSPSCEVSKIGHVKSSKEPVASSLIQLNVSEVISNRYNR